MFHVTKELIHPKKPSAPNGLTLSQADEEGIVIEWSPVSFDGGIKEYKVFRDGTLLDTTTDTDYHDVDVEVVTEYKYTIVAVGNNGEESSYSSEVSATIPLASNLDIKFNDRGLLVLFNNHEELDFLNTDSDVIIEYFEKDSSSSNFEPIENLNADEHTPSNLTKSKVWSGYVVHNNVKYSSGFYDEDYDDLLPTGLIGSYLDYVASYLNEDWATDGNEYKVKLTVLNDGEEVVLEKTITK